MEKKLFESRVVWATHQRLRSVSSLSSSPRESELTRLIVLDMHQRVLHSGLSHTLNEFRKEYWTPEGTIGGKEDCLALRFLSQQARQTHVPEDGGLAEGEI